MSRILSRPLVAAINGTPGRFSCRALVAFLALAMLMAAPAAGQTVATNFNELRFKVKAGDTVYITESSGKSEQEGRVLDLSASSLAVSMGGVRRDLAESNVSRIRQRLPDSKKNGALIGFLVGAAASTAATKTLESPSGSCSGGCIAGSILYGGGLGALAGLGIDALIQGKKDIYERGGQASLHIVMAPLLLPQARGLSVSLRF